MHGVRPGAPEAWGSRTRLRRDGDCVSGVGGMRRSRTRVITGIDGPRTPQDLVLAVVGLGLLSERMLLEDIGTGSCSRGRSALKGLQPVRRPGALRMNVLPTET